MSSSSDSDGELDLPSSAGKCVFGVYLSDKKFGTAMSHFLTQYPYTTAEEGRAQRREERRRRRECVSRDTPLFQAVRIQIIAVGDRDKRGTKSSTAKEYRVVATAQRQRRGAALEGGTIAPTPLLSREDELTVDPASIRFILQKATEDWGSGDMGRVEALRSWCDEYDIIIVEGLNRVYDISMRRSVAINYLVRGTPNSAPSLGAPPSSATMADRWGLYVPASFTAWSAGESLLLYPIEGTGVGAVPILEMELEGGFHRPVSASQSMGLDPNEVSIGIGALGDTVTSQAHLSATHGDTIRPSATLDALIGDLSSTSKGLALRRFEPKSILSKAEAVGALISLATKEAAPDPFVSTVRAPALPTVTQSQRVFIVKPEMGCGHPFTHCHNLIPGSDLKRITPLQFARVFQDLSPFQGEKYNRELAVMGPLVQECVSLQCLPSVYKVYVAGDLIEVKYVDALPMNERVLHTLDRADAADGEDGQQRISRYAFTSSDKELFTRDTTASLFPNLFKEGSPERAQLSEAVNHLRSDRGLGLDFFGIDILVGLPPSSQPPADWVLTTPKYIVDVNYMPGYKGIPEDYLFSSMLKAAAKKAGVTKV